MIAGPYINLDAASSGGVSSLYIKPLFISHNFTNFHVALQQAKVHGPTKTRGAVVVVCFGPIQMMKGHQGHPVMVV